MPAAARRITSRCTKLLLRKGHVQELRGLSVATTLSEEAQHQNANLMEPILMHEKTGGTSILTNTLPSTSMSEGQLLAFDTDVQMKQIAENSAFISTLDMFSIGIGPSSSHTVGPMRASKEFMETLRAKADLWSDIQVIMIDLYGSLALTGQGHGTLNAILWGLLGESPETVEPTLLPVQLSLLSTSGALSLLNDPSKKIAFSMERNFNLHFTEFLPRHSNGMRFSVFNEAGSLLATQTYYSIGGGFIVSDPIETASQSGIFHGLIHATKESNITTPGYDVHNHASNILAFPFSTAAELLHYAESQNRSIASIVESNEYSARPHVSLREGTLKIWHTMEASIQAGCQADAKSLLPGILKVKRRAPTLYKKLSSQPDPRLDVGRMPGLDWLSLYAIAVNEENACGGKVVTAPTNGAAGVLPSVLKYCLEFMGPAGQATSRSREERVCEFLWTAAAIGMLYKKGASLSAAEVGCQGEVGVASSMAAGALTAVLGGSMRQVENAAEIAMEHHLGLTCDPVAGLVQIPCIERNALGAVKALTAAQLALHGDGSHRVSLDQVIATMKQTGADMSHKYKETSLGGLAVNVPLC